MTAPSVEYSLLAPMLLIFGVAVAGVVVEAFAPRGARYRIQFGLAMTGVIAAFGAHVTERQAAHVVVDRRNQRVQIGPLTRGGGPEQSRDIGR